MVTAQLASVPERASILPKVIDSLLPQVDKINVMLNDYTETQLSNLMWLYYDSLDMAIDSRIRFKMRDNRMTDGEKYYDIEYYDGYIFIADDDILYPPNYVEYMISKIEQYGRKAVVSLHGRVWNDLPIRSFYTDRAWVNPWDGTDIPFSMYRCLHDVQGDHRVHCCGDGVSAWHTDTLRMRYDYIELPDMSQLWLALKCNELDIPQIVVDHREGYVKDLLTDEMFNSSIWARNQKDTIQTQIINSRWIVR